MASIPQIRPIFVLTKKDSTDFNRDAVTQRLHITPSQTSAPTHSKGLLTCDSNIHEVEKELSGITILPAASPPYQMLKHAHWSIELPKIETWSLEEPLHRLEQLLCGKESEVSRICKDYNLSAGLIIRVFAESTNMPELIISEKSVCLWAWMGATISFDFYLD